MRLQSAAMRARLVLAALAVALLVAATAGATSARRTVPARGLTTAVYLTGTATGANAKPVFREVAATGARAARIGFYWSAVAPASRPRGFDAADPADPAYDWAQLDEEITNVVKKGLEPIVSMSSTPRWAQSEHERIPLAVGAPVLEEYVAFANAITKRYSGTFKGLPRVRYWMPWNEPNAIYYWAPQTKNGVLVGARDYRERLNAFAGRAHAARADNIVVAGALSPFTRRAPQTIGPLRFMRELLCMSDDPRPRPTCSAKAAFDVWAHHPYTSGGPTHHASNPNDVSLDDLPEMKTLLDAAVRAKHVDTRRHVQFWVTEFSWDTSPPDPNGVPARLHARWVSEALYRMWKSGVSLVTWLQLRDGPYPGDDYQSGLFYRGAKGISSDRPKPALRAFRFPFVAFAQRNTKTITYWGRTPASARATVVIERTEGGGGWRRVGVARAGSFGIFRGSIRSRGLTGYLRARIGNEMSQPFSLAVPPDRPVTPFGVGPRG